MTAWDVSTAVYENKFDDVSGEGVDPNCLFFKPDGTKVYIPFDATTKVAQYALSTPWDISTSAYEAKFKDVGAQATAPTGVFFKDDGTKMYVLCSTTTNVYQYALSTPWDVSTATYETKFKDVGGEGTNTHALTFKPDGSKMYVGSPITTRVSQYALSTPWDVSTAAYETKFKDVSGEDGFITGVFFKTDGTKMYVASRTNNIVYQYSLSTAWDVSTATYDTIFKDVSAQDGDIRGLFFKSDGTKMYIIGLTNKTVYQYDLPVPGTNIQINIGDAWKDVDELQINIGDVWKDVAEVKINIGDVWKDVF